MVALCKCFICLNGLGHAVKLIYRVTIALSVSFHIIISLSRERELTVEKGVGIKLNEAR